VVRAFLSSQLQLSRNGSSTKSFFRPTTRFQNLWPSSPFRGSPLTAFFGVERNLGAFPLSGSLAIFFCPHVPLSFPRLSLKKSFLKRPLGEIRQRTDFLLNSVFLMFPPIFNTVSFPVVLGKIKDWTLHSPFLLVVVLFRVGILPPLSSTVSISHRVRLDFYELYLVFLRNFPPPRIARGTPP